MTAPDGGHTRYVAIPYTGVYNLYLQHVEWRKAETYPITVGNTIRYVILPYAGVYDPIAQKVEWKVATYLGR